MDFNLSLKQSESPLLNNFLYRKDRVFVTREVEQVNNWKAGRLTFGQDAEPQVWMLDRNVLGLYEVNEAYKEVWVQQSKDIHEAVYLPKMEVQ